MKRIEFSADRPPTSIDVARLAGCSQAAVSLWMTGKYIGRLSPELQARIAAAVSQLGYRTNKTAQRLSSGTGKSVTFFFPGFRYHYFGSILDGVNQAIDRSWQLSFVDSRPSDERRAPESIFSASVGTDTTVILVASPSERDLAALELVHGPRMIIVDAPHAIPGARLVAYDIDPALERAAAHLRGLGHERIGYIGLENAPSLTLQHRRRYLADKLAAAGGKEPLYAELSPSAPDLLARMQKLVLAWRQQQVTAIVAADERLAYVVMRVASNQRIRIPNDLSLLSFNDSDAAALLNPGLASIRLPPEDLGRAAGTLIRRSAATVDTVKIPAEFIARPSLGRAP